MAIYKTYKQREIEQNEECIDVYVYNQIPEKLRPQVILIMHSLFDKYYWTSYDNCYDEIHNFFLREEGVFTLNTLVGMPPSRNDNPETEISYLLLKTEDILLFLSVVEYIFVIATKRYGRRDVKLVFKRPSDALEELNERFRRSNFGYELVDGQIIRIDSKELHKKIVKPSLSLLSSDPIFKGADDEYRAAFGFYKTGDFEQTLVECSKAIESCLIAIIEKRKWGLPSKPTTKPLLSKCKEKGLFTSTTEGTMNKLVSLIQAIYIERSQDGGHGQGTEIRNISRIHASYILHMTATNIIFLIESDKELG